MNMSIYTLTGLHCGNCVRRIQQILLPFADEVTVTLDPMQARLSGLHAEASLPAMQAAVAGLGNYHLEDFNKNTALNGIVPAQSAIKKIVEEATPSFLQTYRPLLMIVAYILAGSVLIQFGQHAGHGMSAASSISAHETMRYFMAGFFLTFSFFKLLDVEAFANAYAGYDLLAARWHGWGYVYPFVELTLGLAYLANFQPALTNWATLLIMGFSAIGVIRAVMSKTKIQCACLGTVFKLPMSTVTVIEDVGMMLMAAWMLYIQ